MRKKVKKSTLWLELGLDTSGSKRKSVSGTPNLNNVLKIIQLCFVPVKNENA